MKNICSTIIRACCKEWVWTMKSHIGNVFRVTPENFQITQAKIISHIRKRREKKKRTKHSCRLWKCDTWMYIYRYVMCMYAGELSPIMILSSVLMVKLSVSSSQFLYYNELFFIYCEIKLWDSPKNLQIQHLRSSNLKSHTALKRNKRKQNKNFFLFILALSAKRSMTYLRIL